MFFCQREKLRSVAREERNATRQAGHRLLCLFRHHCIRFTNRRSCPQFNCRISLRPVTSLSSRSHPLRYSVFVRYWHVFLQVHWTSYNRSDDLKHITWFLLCINRMLFVRNIFLTAFLTRNFLWSKFYNYLNIITEHLFAPSLTRYCYFEDLLFGVFHSSLVFHRCNHTKVKSPNYWPFSGRLRNVTIWFILWDRFSDLYNSKIILELVWINVQHR